MLLVMLEDKAVLEIKPGGTCITVGLAMACTSDFNAEEALAAISHNCRPCVQPPVGISLVILMDVLYESPCVLVPPFLQ